MNSKKIVGFACDHAAYDMKELLVGYISAKGYEVIDFGCHSEERCDYADFVSMRHYENFFTAAALYCNKIAHDVGINLVGIWCYLCFYIVGNLVLVTRNTVYRYKLFN